MPVRRARVASPIGVGLDVASRKPVYRTATMPSASAPATSVRGLSPTCATRRARRRRRAHALERGRERLGRRLEPAGLVAEGPCVESVEAARTLEPLAQRGRGRQPHVADDAEPQRRRRAACRAPRRCRGRARAASAPRPRGTRRSDRSRSSSSSASAETIRPRSPRCRPACTARCSRPTVPRTAPSSRRTRSTSVVVGDVRGPTRRGSPRTGRSAAGASRP